jgi:uncharacterized membrane protein YhaH (DUF805 family)
MPFAIALAILVVAVRSLRDSDASGVVLAILLMAPAIYVIATVTKSVVLFWMDPYARGDLIGL